MKQFLLIGTFAFSFAACNNDNKATDTTITDSTTTHTEHNAAGHSGMNTDTTRMGSKSMMAMMTAMMDNMKGMTSSGNPDNDFANLMKVHHLGAIEMAQREVAQGTNAEIKAMAQKMIDEQQAEVAEFNTFLSSHSPHGGGDAFFKEAMTMMNNMKMDMDHSGSIDKQFVQMMIPHHQSAVDMSKAYMRQGAHEEKLKRMANAIIASQEKEIGEPKAWLAKN